MLGDTGIPEKRLLFRSLVGPQGASRLEKGKHAGGGPLCYMESEPTCTEQMGLGKVGLCPADQRR